MLVIKLGALGDFVHAFHGFAAIRASRPGSHITLLTTAPFRALAEAAPWFDAVAVDARAPWWNLAATLRTVRPIRRFDFVFDLQTSRRTARYHALAGRPPWCGHARHSSHRHANPARDRMHTLERQREQLELAGIDCWPAPERGWLAALGHRHGMHSPYALLMPGGAGIGAVKRWPVAGFAAVAAWLAERGLTPVVVGGAAERALGATISAATPRVRDLTGQTSLADIAALAQGAALALGNDTGPLHLATAMGAPGLALFPAASVLEQAAPRGPLGEWAAALQVTDLATLPVARVTAALAAMLEAAGDAPSPLPGPPPAAGRTSLRSAAK